MELKFSGKRNLLASCGCPSRDVKFVNFMLLWSRTCQTKKKCQNEKHMCSNPVFSISFSSAGKGQFLTSIFLNNLCRDCRRQELLLTVAWGGKFYWLSPDKENTARSLTLNLTITLNINSMRPCRLAYDQTTSKALPRNLYQLQDSDVIHVCNWRTAPQADETWGVNGKVHAWGY